MKLILDFLKRNIWAVLFVVFLLLWWPFKWSPFPRLHLWGNDPIEEVTVEVNQRYVDSLKVIIATYQMTEDSFDIKIKTLTDSLHILQTRIRQDQFRITELKRRTDEKISNVDKLSTIELTKLLSERYKDSIK